MDTDDESGLDQYGLEIDAVPARSRGKQGIQEDRNAARRALREIVTGRQLAKAGQMQGIKMLLADELEPEKDANPYSGIPEDELAERMVVTACSILGIRKLTDVLKRLALAGEADVLTGFVPDADVVPLDDPKDQVGETEADTEPQPLHGDGRTD